MSDWINNALEALAKSLKPFPQELNEIDWKSGLSPKSQRLAQHISAFANRTGGGFLAYGINNSGTPETLSLEEMDEIVKKLGNIARNNLAQPVGLEHKVEIFEDHPVLFIHIPEQIQKPVYLRGETVYESYKRSAGQTVKMSQVEVKQLIAFSSGVSFESQISSSKSNIDEVLSLLDYENFFRLMGKPSPFSREVVADVLENEEMIVKTPYGWDILNLGAIAFARDLEEFKELRRKAIRVIVYKDTSRITALKEQQGIRGYGTAFKGLINYIMDQLPTSEIIESALRRKEKLYPEVAIREFVANALIHQDFSITGAGVMIEIFKDRIEITNPGLPLVDTNRFIDTAPKSRNESLASLMRRLNICEERGSGIDRAIEAIETFQLPAPKFLKGDDYTRVIMYAPMSLTRMNTEDRIRACYQHTCLHYVNNQTVNNQSVRKRFNISKNNQSLASKIISETIEAGLIKPSDPDNSSKKFASYIPYWA